ncbi:MAG: zinc metalloprotease HtpX [Candidatus Micrarchaeota archaeon]|nr:zinc metalloprotease HtpX [Candidatus Micrarchaeota archaeon]
MAGNSFYDQIAANKRNSYFLIFVVFALVFAVVYAFSFIFIDAGDFGFIVGAALAAIYITITYFFADSIVLSMSGAREAQKHEFPYLVNVVEGLSLAAGIPTPKIYVIDDAGLNAFATGTTPQKASVAFTTGLLKAMNRQELEGVAAHEISHIKNLDCRMGTLVVVMVGLIAILSDIGVRSMFWGRRGGFGGGGSDRGRGNGEAIFMIIGILIVILAPIVAQLVRLALSRQREYLADASGVQLTRYPPGLASALEKIKSSGSVVQRASETTASLYFANPLSMGSLLSTHPPIDDRIKRIKEMKG